MSQLPKAAHRTEEQRVVGYLGAAREALNNARYPIGNDNPAYDRLGAMIEETYEIERAFLDYRAGRITRA